MNVRKKKILLLGVIGAVMGIAIWLIMLLTQNPKALSGGSLNSNFILLNVILSAVFGALCMGGAVVYDIEEWSILRATFTHFAIVFASFNIVGLSLQWFSFGSIEYWIIHAVMIVAYILVWLIQYLIYKRKIKELNRELENWKSMQNKRRNSHESNQK